MVWATKGQNSAEAMMRPTFDIFTDSPGARPAWIDSAQDFEDAKERLREACPNSARTAAKATNAARTKSKPPAILAARCSACSPRDDGWKRQSTTAAERSSTALSPPKPRSDGLRAAQAAPNDTTASTLIQASVRT